MTGLSLRTCLYQSHLTGSPSTVYVKLEFTVKGPPVYSPSPLTKPFHSGLFSPSSSQQDSSYHPHFRWENRGSQVPKVRQPASGVGNQTQFSYWPLPPPRTTAKLRVWDLGFRESDLNDSDMMALRMPSFTNLESRLKLSTEWALVCSSEEWLG